MTGYIRILILLVVFISSYPSAASEPMFEIEPNWPKTLPNNWILGEVDGIAVDSQNHIWINNRPRSIPDDQKGVSSWERRTKCCVPAPPILEFDQEGNVVQGWGGQSQGIEWPSREHGIFVDKENTVWISGNGINDGMVLHFTRNGQVIRQYGHSGPGKGSLDTSQMARPSDIAVDEERQEVYFSDGYTNHRIIVFDSKTGNFKRMWGAYGSQPTDLPFRDFVLDSPQFSNPVHCIVMSKDGLLYVCDRGNNRIQVFDREGHFVNQYITEPDTFGPKGQGSVWDIDFWPKSSQEFIILVDGANDEMRVLRRVDGQVVFTAGRPGRQAGQFHKVHSVAVDDYGNVFTTETLTGNRIQKWRPKNNKN